MDISIVIPLLDEEESLQELVERIDEQLVTLKKEYEILFIDDGSTDSSFNVIPKSFARLIILSSTSVKFLMYVVS